MHIRIFSFFSGVGLLDLGFEDAGFEVVRVNEFHRPFLDGYRHSREVLGRAKPKFGFDSESIDSFLQYPHKLEELKRQVELAGEDGSVVGFIGGPPCPDFSVGGKNKGQHGENGRLSGSFVDLISACNPDFFLFENVKGLWRTKRHRHFYDLLKVQLLNSQYALTNRLINAIEYGVPQDRERIILLGFNEKARGGSQGDEVDFPWDEFKKWDAESVFNLDWPAQEPFVANSTKKSPPSIIEELTVQYWFEKNAVHAHPNATHCFKPREGLRRFESVDEGDDSKKSYKRLHRWRYSPTACYGNNEVHLHPYLPRRINVAEALSIQSMPRGFELPDDMSLSDMFKTVGNGVPFLAATSVAKSIRKFLQDQNHASDRTRSSVGNFSAAEAAPI